MDSATTSALDQLEGLTSSHAVQVVAYYRILITGGIPTDTASELAGELAKDLRRMAFPKPK